MFIIAPTGEYMSMLSYPPLFPESIAAGLTPVICPAKIAANTTNPNSTAKNTAVSKMTRTLFLYLLIYINVCCNLLAPLFFP